MKKTFIYFLICIISMTANPVVLFAFSNNTQSKPVKSDVQPTKPAADEDPPLPGEVPQNTPTEYKPAGYPNSQQVNSQENICALAKKDAKSDNGGSFWMWSGLGCASGIVGSPLLGIVAIICGYNISMSVPSNRIIGKSSSYVKDYVMCYQEETRSENGGSAIVGCVGSALVYLAVIAVYYIMFASIMSSAVSTSVY